MGYESGYGYGYDGRRGDARRDCVCDCIQIVFILWEIDITCEIDI